MLIRTPHADALYISIHTTDIQNTRSRAYKHTVYLHTYDTHYVYMHICIVRRGGALVESKTFELWVRILL